MLRVALAHDSLRRGLLTAATITLAATAVLSAEPPGAKAVPAQYNGNLVAFESYRSGNGDIYVVEAGGGEATAVVPHPAQDRNPAWEPTRTSNSCPQHPPITPDKQRLAFESTRNAAGGVASTFDIHILYPDVPNNTGESHALLNLTQDPGTNDTMPAWSSSAYGVDGLGSVIAYASASATAAGAKRDIYVIDPATGNRVNLTNDPSTDESNPDWGPGYVAYDSDRGGTRQIWYVGVGDGDGDGVPEAVEPPVQVTRPPTVASEPSWFHYTMPDEGEPMSRLAHQLAYRTAAFDTTYLDILEHAYDADGPPPATPFETTTVLPLTGDPGGDGAPSWSPLGSDIVYDSTRGDPAGLNRDIHVLRSEGSQPLMSAPALTTSLATDVNPAWQGAPQCAQAMPRLPVPAPVVRTKKQKPDGGGGGGNSGSGSGSGSEGSRPGQRPNTASRLTVRGVRVKATGRRGRRRVTITLTINRPARATIRLLRGRRAVARRTFRLHRGRNRLAVRVPRSARRGHYRVSIRIPGARPRTIVRSVRLRR